MEKPTDALRSFATTETPEIKASRAKRFHVVTTGDMQGFVFGYDTSAEAVACTETLGSSVGIWDTEASIYHMRKRGAFAAGVTRPWVPSFADVETPRREK